MVSGLPLPPLKQIPVGEYALPGPLRERLVAATLSGEKTAAAAPLEEFSRFNEPPPALGDVEVVVNSSGTPVCLTEVTEVRAC